MKDITIDFISSLHAESVLLKVMSKTIFNHFVNDDIKEAASFKNLFEFLYNHYFS